MQALIPNSLIEPNPGPMFPAKPYRLRYPGRELVTLYFDTHDDACEWLTKNPCRGEEKGVRLSAQLPEEK